MNDAGYHLATAITERLKTTNYTGAYRLPHELLSAIEQLEYELWRDLMRPGSLWSNIRLIHNGRDVHPSKFMAGRIGDGLIVHSHIDATQLSAYLLDGATMIYNHLHETSRIVQRLQETLEYQLGARAWVQAYLTKAQPDKSAFGLHVDDHNVVVLQVAGIKSWAVQFDSTASDDTPQKTTLQAGDFLAFPANTPHHVSACGQLSLHLTVAFDWLDDRLAGSTIPTADLDTHKSTSRTGSTLPLALCSEKPAGRLPFRFRDRVRPRITTTERGTQIDCHAGTYLVDPRFSTIAETLANGRELTKADICTMAPDLSDGDIDKFLRFGIDNEFLSCSG